MIVVDMQNDFLPGGSLAIDEADTLVPIINKLMRTVDFVILTQDFHPSTHTSFVTNGGPYPSHCVVGTQGARFHPELDTDAAHLIIRKGFRPSVDSPSAFCEQIFDADGGNAQPSGLEAYLRGVGVRTVLVVGVALDICVLQTAIDAAAAGFSVFVSAAGTRGTTTSRTDETWHVLQAHGVGRVEEGLPIGIGDGWRSAPPPVHCTPSGNGAPSIPAAIGGMAVTHAITATADADVSAKPDPLEATTTSTV